MANPIECFMNVRDHLQKMGKFVGANVLLPNYKPNWCTYATITAISIYCIGTFYTIYIEISRDWKNILNCMCMFGTVFAAIIKLLSAVVYKSDMWKSIACLADLYTEYSNKSKKLNITLKKNIKMFSYLLKTFFLVYLVVTMIIMFAPPLIYFTTRKMLLVLTYYIPGIEPPLTPAGYWFTSMVHSINLLYGSIGCYAADSCFILFSFHIYVLSQVLKYKVEELNDALYKKEIEKKIAIRVLDIARFHQNFCKYCKIIEKMYFWNAFFQIGMSGFSICLTLFIILCGDWPGAPVYLIYLIVSMYLYCALGTLVEYSCDEMINYICNINWYYLSPSQKRNYQIILMRAQSPTLITVGGVMPLSVNTGLQVTKSIYSLFMMLLQFV